MRVRVKICGITNLDDALLAAALGADALGFIFVPRSPRYLTPEAARMIVDRLPVFVTPVAVMVDESLAVAREIMERSGCRVAQLHGDEDPGMLDTLGWPAIKALRVAADEDLASLARYSAARAILLDTKVAGQHGGTGITFDWRLAREASRCGKPIMLAGGLTPDNVEAAVAAAAPYAVDVSSGVEQEPGRKDPERLRRLFAVLRASSRPTSSR